MFSTVLSFICGTFQMIFSCFNFILYVVVSIFSTIVDVSAVVFQTAFNILKSVLSSFSFILDPAHSVLGIIFSTVFSFICSTFEMIFSCFNFTLNVVVSIFSTIVDVCAVVFQAAFNTLNSVLSPFSFLFDAAHSVLSIMFSPVLSFIYGAFQMIFSCFNLLLSVIVSTLNATFSAILTVTSRLKYVYSFFETHLQLLLILDTKRTVLLVLFIVILSQIWKMRQRRLAFEAELKRLDQRKRMESNSVDLGFSGKSWKSGRFDGKLPNFSRESSYGDFNRILDFALRELCHRCRGNISVGPINITDKVPFFQTDWLLRADDCVLNHLDTAHRVGSATTCEEAGGALVLDAAIGLRKLRVTVVNYFAHVVLWWLPSICASGECVGTVESLSLRAEVALKTPFAAELRSLRITNMGPPQVRITGLGFWSSFLWNMLESTLLSRERLENCLKPVFEGVLQDLTSHVSAIPTTRQVKLQSPPYEAIFTREEQIKMREVTTVQTVRSYETLPRETASTSSQYRSEIRPWETTSTLPGYRSESHRTETTSTFPEYRSEIRSWETASTIPGYQSEIRSWETASSTPRYRSEVYPREVTTVQTIRDYERNTRERVELLLATAPAPPSSADAIAIGITAGILTFGAIFGISSAIASSRSRR